MGSQKKEASENNPSGIINKPKTAFFITPLGTDDSPIRRNTNGVINAVIRPVLAKHNIHLIPPHEIDNPGNITRQIIAQILTADLVIADLTGLNPNVMYELAVRHARRLPVIVICQHDTKLPFDIAAERTFFYYNDMAGTVQLIQQLDKTIPKALEDTQPDNPIYNGLEASIIQKITEESDDPVRSYIVEKLAVVDELNSSVKALLNDQFQYRFPSRIDLINNRLNNNYTAKQPSAEPDSGVGSLDWLDPKLEPVDIDTLVTGDVIVHKKFGTGMIIDIMTKGKEKTATIKFRETMGTKTILLTFAKDKIKLAHKPNL